MNATVLGEGEENKSYMNLPVLKEDAKYYSLFEQATDAIMVTNFKGEFKDVNSACCMLFGYTKQELLTMNVKQMVSCEELETNPIRFDLLAADKNIIRERQMIHRNGAIIYVEANAKKIDDDGILVIARDVTERKRVEQLFLKSEANLHTIFDNTDTIYVLMDNDFKIISYNSRAYDFAIRELGHHLEISEYLLDYFPDEKRQVIQAYLQAAAVGTKIDYEINYPQQDSSMNWYHVRIFPVSKEGHAIYGLMMAVSNITEKKLLEQKLLDQKVQEQREIIRAVLHAQEIERNRIGQELHDNVNQILSTVGFYLKSIEKDTPNRKETIEKSRELIRLAIEEIHYLSQMQVTPQKQYDLKVLIEKMIKDIHDNIKTTTKFYSHISYHLAIDEDLKLNIYRIIQEQINNILKYSMAQQATISIEENNGAIDILIIDDGIGFEMEVKKNGIGISNIINRVESHNGKVVIDTAPGKGCAIKIKIPG